MFFTTWQGGISQEFCPALNGLTEGLGCPWFLEGWYKTIVADNPPAVRFSLLTSWTRISLLLSANCVLVAMVPCFGFLNWGVAPLCLFPIVLGSVGLAVARSRQLHPGPFLGALIGGSLMMVVSVLRLLLGAGVI